jgi:hypothetical protein
MEGVETPITVVATAKTALFAVARLRRGSP